MFIFAQLEGPVQVADAKTRSDCTLVSLPQDCVGFVTGTKRNVLSRIEDDYGVVSFFLNLNHTSQYKEQKEK